MECTAVLSLIGPTVLIAVGRLVVSLFLLIIQAYVLRAMLGVVRSVGLRKNWENSISFVLLLIVFLFNLPLFFFIGESVLTPRYILFYAPPPRYEAVMRPFAYVFFVWTLGSFMFSMAAPLVMSVFAGVQFFRRRSTRSNPDASDTTIDVLDLSRRRFLRMAMLAVASMPFAVSAYGAIAARSRRVIERVVVPIAGLPLQLDGLTIVHMSDIHAGLFMAEDQMKEYVEIANSLNPDIVALTGDFVATSSSQVPAFINAMAGLRARLGVYGCLGNHDMFTRSEEPLLRGFANAGLKLLRRKNEILDVNGAKLNIIGVDYIAERFGASSLSDALRGISLEGTTVLLCHTPNPFPEAAEKGIDLMLSGHTHGGQIALTIGDLIITPARLMTMFLAGLFKIGASHLYVNRGLGTTGPPIRINAPPEITHISLKSAY
jgi:uncharacterized protein